MAGNGFSGEQILTLTGERILLIWYRLRNKPLLKSIEWSSLSAELVGKHFSLFTNDELDALTADNTPQFKDIVTSALKRHPQGVLFALYKSLLDTQGCGGAAQHASIAEEIQKETLATPGLQPAFTTDGTHPSAAVPGYPSNSQLASAEHDRGLRVEQEDGTATTYHPTWQTGKVSTMMERQDSLVSQPVEDRRPARFQYYGVESASQGLSQPVQQQPMTTMSNTYSSAPDPDGPPLPQSASAEHDRSLHEAQAPVTAATANPPQQTEQAESRSYTNGTPPVKQEAWQEIVAFIQSCMKTAHKDVLPGILREVLGGKASKFMRSDQGKQILSETLETLVQDRKMTWFEFARYLIRAPSARMFIFAIWKHNNHATIRYDFKKVLKRHLGSSWQQLARTMGVHKGDIDAIAVKYPNELPVQVDEFLDTYKFPYVGSDKETADLLIDILMSASLTPVATNVKRDLEFELDLEDIGSTGHYLPHRVPTDKCQAAIRNFEESCSAEPAPFDDSPGQQENEMKVLQYGHLGYPEARQYPPPKPELKAYGDSDWQESRKECATEFNTSKQLVATASSQIPAEWTAATDHECGAWDGNVTIVLDTQDDNVSAIFAWFEDQMNEDELFQKISDRTYPGLLLVRQEDNKHLIHFAAERGYARIMESLLQTGYSVDVRTKNGQSPFLLACEAGHEDVIRYLLTLDPRLASTKDALDRSCLHWPAILRNENLMSDLIYLNNADVDAKSKTGVTPLSVACIMGELPIVHQLVHALRLKLSGSRHVKNHRKASRLPPLHAAAFGGHQHIMEYLLSLEVDGDNDHESILELIDPDFQSNHAYTALHIAACRGYKAIVEMLVEQYKCMVNTSALDKTTPLLLAAASGHEDVVKYLLEHEAEVDSTREVRRGTFHLTPLGEAALGRHVEVVKLLLGAGADFTFKAGGTTSILALACIGGDEEIVQLLLSKLEDEIGRTFTCDMLHEFFEMPFVVSMDFQDYKCAKQLMDYMNDKIGSIDVIIRTFMGKVDYRMIEQLRQYKEMIDPISGLDLSNQGDTCRRVAGSRMTAMYHLCYDDGPHWATELMQLCFMFEIFSKPETFHTTYEKVYMEASKCILQTLVHVQDYTYESLTSAAIERGSEQAASFFSQYGEDGLKDRVLFLEQVHSGNPSAMGVCCELVSADHLQETYMSEMAGPVAQQYFMEMSRREMKHPGQFRMKFSTHGSRGTGLRLRKDGQAGPSPRPRPPPAAHIAAAHKGKSTDHIPSTTSTIPQPSALDEHVALSASAQLEDKPKKLESSASLNAPCTPHLGSTEVKPSVPKADDLYVSSFIPDSNLCVPVDCSQENDSTDSAVVLPEIPLSDCFRMKVRSVPATLGTSSLLQRNALISHSDPGHMRRSPEQLHAPDVKTSLFRSHSSEADRSEPHSGSHMQVPPPPSVAPIELCQLSQSQNASGAQQSDGTGHSPRTVPTHTVPQSNVEMPSQSSQGYHTMNHSNMGRNPLWDKAAEPAVLTSADLPLPQQPQHQNSNPESTEKSECDTAPELNHPPDIARSSDSLTDLNRSGSPLLPQALTPPQLAAQSASGSILQPSPPEPLHLSAAAEVPRSSRPDTIGGAVQDDLPPAPPPIAMGGAPDQPESDEGLADSVSSEPDTAAARSSNQPAPADSADYVPQQSNSQADAPHTSPKSHAAPSVTHTKEHSLSACAANHPVQQNEPAPHDGNLEEEDNEDDAQSDITYLSSTSASTTHNVNVDDSRRNSMSHNVPASGPAVQPNTAPVKALNPLASSAVATTGQSEVSPSVSIHTTVALPQSDATGQDQSENSGQSVPTPVHNCESPLSSHPSQPPSSRPPYQPPSPHPNTSSKVPSQVNPMVVRPPSEVPYVTESSMETYQSAATVVEAPYQAEVTTPPASSKHIELSSVPKFERHDSGYPGSNQFDSSVLLGRHGNMEPQARAPMEGYQLEQDMRESSQSAESMGQIGDQLIGSSTQEQEERLTDLSRQVGRKWSMLARYAGLKEDEVQEIKDAQEHAEDRSCVAMEKIQGRLTWNELLFIVHKQMHMLNSAAKLQDFLGHQVDALPLDVVQKEIDPQQHGRTVLLASQCVSEHWRELAQHLGINSREHWEVLEQSTEDDEKCLELLMLWLRSNTNVTLQQLLQAVESTSASAGTLHQLIEKAQEFPDGS